jgi:site-specific DNA-methyltransferase (adenine-specific)
MKVTNNINLTCEDNMELMARYPDNYFELAIVDPPYGINRDGHHKVNAKKASHSWKKYDLKGWDNAKPLKEYWLELFRVSKNQVVCGANYFVEYLPPSMGWVVWDKGQRLTMSDGELIFTSENKALRIYKLNRVYISKNGGSIHPTQKPVKLYEWLLMNYAKEGDKILDTHLGSMSIAIACHNLGYELTGCELDKEYYDQGIKRVKNHIAQQRLF